MYIAVILIHSWLRWIVLGLGVTLASRCALGWQAGGSWTDGSERLRVAFLRVLDVQVAVGLVLYLGLSPLSRAGFSDLGSALGDSVLRFYTIEHVFGMLSAVAVAHVGLERSARLDPARRYRAAAVTLSLWLLVTLVSVPWPGLLYGRPWFRLGLG